MINVIIPLVVNSIHLKPDLNLNSEIVMRSRINTWIKEHAITLLRISIGIIYVWFGALKFFPQLSPADQLAKDTIHVITLGLIPDETSIILLALWETILGVLLIIGIWNRPVFYFLLLHLACTFVPLFFFIDLSFTHLPYGFTLVGQYIMKNIIIVCAAIVINIYAKAAVAKT